MCDDDDDAASDDDQGDAWGGGQAATDGDVSAALAGAQAAYGGGGGTDTSGQDPNAAEQSDSVSAQDAANAATAADATGADTGGAEAGADGGASPGAGPYADTGQNVGAGPGNTPGINASTVQGPSGPDLGVAPQSAQPSFPASVPGVSLDQLLAQPQALDITQVFRDAFRAMTPGSGNVSSLEPGAYASTPGVSPGDIVPEAFPYSGNRSIDPNDIEPPPGNQDPGITAPNSPTPSGRTEPDPNSPIGVGDVPTYRITPGPGGSANYNPSNVDTFFSGFSASPPSDTTLPGQGPTSLSSPGPAGNTFADTASIAPTGVYSGGLGPGLSTEQQRASLVADANQGYSSPSDLSTLAALAGYNPAGLGSNLTPANPGLDRFGGLIGGSQPQTTGNTQPVFGDMRGPAPGSPVIGSQPTGVFAGGSPPASQPASGPAPAGAQPASSAAPSGATPGAGIGGRSLDNLAAAASAAGSRPGGSGVLPSLEQMIAMFG